MANIVKYMKVDDEVAVNGLVSESEDDSCSDKETDTDLLHVKEGEKRKRFLRNHKWCRPSFRCSPARFLTVAIGLTLFAIALTISVILTQILNEPREAPQYNGDYSFVIHVHIFNCLY